MGGGGRVNFINFFFHVTELLFSHWDWLNFTSSAYTFHPYIIEFDTSYDPNGPRAQAVDVGNFKCLDTLSLSFPHFGILFQLFKDQKPVGSSRKWLSKCLEPLISRNYESSVRCDGPPTWVSCYCGGRPKGVVLTMSSKAIFLAPLSLWSQYTIWQLGMVPF